MADRLLTLRETLGKAQAALQAANDEIGEVEPSQEQQAAFDGALAEVKRLRAAIDREETVAREAARRAEPVTPTVAPRAEPRAKTQPVPGQSVARMIRALAAAKGNPMLAAQFAERHWGPDGEPIARALATSDGASGGFLVPEEYSMEIIELLRSRTAMRRAGAMVMPMNGTLLVPKLTAGSAAAYVGENQNIQKTQPSFGQLRLTSRKLAALVPISNDLLRTANPMADRVVIDDLVAAMSVTEDRAFLREDGTGNAPKGLRNWMAAGNVESQGGTTSDDIEADLKLLLNNLEGNDVRMLRPTWFLAPRSKNHLMFLRDPNGNLIFPEVRDANTLLGFPLQATTSIPSNLGGGGNESELYFADMADCVIGEEAGIELAVSDTAAYHDGSNVVAAFSQDQTVIRAIAKHDFALRHDLSATVLTGVTWGG